MTQSGCGHFRTRPLKVSSVDMGTYSLGYEIHGNTGTVDYEKDGLLRVACIMGFMNSMGAWERVVDHFLTLGDGRAYQFLVLDNRGIGQSSQGPFTRMTTTSLAKDALVVLDHAGWVKERSVHLMGISMGGMICQEMAFLSCSHSLQQSRFKSLTLLVTGPYWRPPRNNLFVGLSVLRGSRSDVDARVKSLMSIIYSDEDFLESPPNLTKYPNYQTNRDQIHASLKKRLETVKNPSLSTFLGQLNALVTHNVSPQRLAKIGEAVPAMLAVGALADKIMDPRLSDEIAKYSGCKLIQYRGKGHVITTEAEVEGIMDEIHSIWLAGEELYTVN